MSALLLWLMPCAMVVIRNITLLEVKGTLRDLNDAEQSYSADAGVVISEVCILLVFEDGQVDKADTLICTLGHIGPNISGWVYVSPIEEAWPIGGKDS